MYEKDGGPAFPVSSYVNSEGQTFDSAVQGMTLRDYFAAKALQGLLASPKELKTDDLGQLTSSHIAEMAWDISDAMLEERDKHE